MCSQTLLEPFPSRTNRDLLIVSYIFKNILPLGKQVSFLCRINTYYQHCLTTYCIYYETYNSLHLGIVERYD